MYHTALAFLSEWKMALYITSGALVHVHVHVHVHVYSLEVLLDLLWQHHIKRCAISSNTSITDTIDIPIHKPRWPPSAPIRSSS